VAVLMCLPAAVKLMGGVWGVAGGDLVAYWGDGRDLVMEDGDWQEVPAELREICEGYVDFLGDSDFSYRREGGYGV